MSFKLTERELASILRDDASLMITQPEGESGEEIESLRRIKVSDFISQLRARHLLTDAAAYPADSASGNPAEIEDGADGVPVKALSIAIRPAQAGSGDPAPDNERTISGWTGETVTCCGKNLLKLRDTLAPVTIQGVAWQLNEDGSISASRASSSSNNSDWSVALLTLPAGDYVFSSLASGTGGGSTYQANIKIGGTSHWGANAYSFTLTQATEIEVVLRYYSGYSGDAVFYPMVRLQSQSSEFEAYQGAACAIPFPAEAGTVYGGTLDALTGELLSDWVLFETTWGAGTQKTVSDGLTTKSFALPGMFGALQDEAPARCNLCPYLKSTHAYTEPAFQLVLEQSGGSMRPAAAIALPSDTSDDQVVQVAYVGTTQSAFRVTPAEAYTLLGYNQIYADCGDVTVEYRADPTLYIARKIAGAVNG